MCAIGRSLSSASRTPRSISSCGHFFGRAIAGRSPLARTDHPGFEASAKTGLAHEILKDIARNGSNAAARIAAIKELRALRLEVERQRGVDVFARLYELPSPELRRSTPGG